MEDFITPPKLRELGYSKYPELQALNAVYCTKMDHENRNLTVNKFWADWRGILEYLECVEEAKTLLLSIPSDNSIFGLQPPFIKYNSVALIFFAQATLDLLAVWLTGSYDLSNVKNSNLAFHKEKFKIDLVSKDSNFKVLFDNYELFIEYLSDYRNNWIHRMSGGAVITVDRDPNDIEAIFSVSSPASPTYFVDMPRRDALKIQELNQLSVEKYGKTLHAIDDFASEFANNIREIVLLSLNAALQKFQ